MIRYDMATRRGQNRVQQQAGGEMGSSSISGGVQHVDEAGEQQAGSSTTAAGVGQPVPREDEESRFAFKCE